MSSKTIEITIEINSPVRKVWEVFTNPEVTRKMGGEYVTNWQIGGDFGFKKPDGTMVTRGKLLAFEPEELLRHSLFNPDTTTLMAVLTYTLKEANGKTQLTGKEEFTDPLNGADYQDSLEGWQAALNAVKELAES